MISRGRKISEFEEAQLCNNRLLRRNSNLSTENQQLYQQVDDLTTEIKTLRTMLLESCEDFKSKSGRRLSPMTHGKDELMLELASVCEENKKLHIQIEKLTSALQLKEKESKSMNTEPNLLREETTEILNTKYTLGTISQCLEESTEHRGSSYRTEDNPGSKRNVKLDISLTSDDILCTSANSNKKEIGNGVQGELVHKGHESTMITTNEDSSIDDSLVLCKDLHQIDSGRSFGYSKAGAFMTNYTKMSSIERNTLESRRYCLESLNENLTKEICDHKNNNEQITQDYTLNLKNLQIMNSNLEKKANEYQEHDERLKEIQEKNFRLEIENGKLHKCVEDAALIKTENKELKLKLEIKTNECITHETIHKDKLKLECSLKEHVKMLELLQHENEMLLKRNEKLLEMECNDIMQKSEIENLKIDIWCLEKIVQEQADRHNALEKEVEDLTGQIEMKETEIVEARKENCKIRSKVLDLALEVEDIERIKCENERHEAINVEQRDTICNLHVQKAELATEVDSLKSRLGGLSNIQHKHDELMNELEMYKRMFYDKEIKYKEATSLLVELDTKIDNKEEELVDANKLVEKLSKEKIQLIDECSRSTESIKRLKGLLANRSQEKLLQEEKIIKCQEEVLALKIEVESQQSSSNYNRWKVLPCRCKSHASCYMPENFDKKYHSLKYHQAQEKEGCNESNEEEVEDANLKLKYEAPKEKRGFKTLECAYERWDTSSMSSKCIRSFQERLDALMQSNAMLVGEKIEMEKYVEETVAENESWNAQVSEVCYHT